MKELLDKLTSYNLFNYLLPGVLFAIISGKFSANSLTLGDAIVGAFVCYFIGLAISRFGSLIIEPTLKKISFVKFSDYSAYVTASKQDPTLEILSEANNMYRTLSSMLVLLILYKFYGWIELKLSSLRASDPYILIVLLLILFLYSYRKQTQYITKRIKTNNGQ